MTLPNRTFGIEIEIKGLSERQACRALVEAGINASETGYTHRVSSSWKVLYDGSLSGTSCEVVSPVLRGEDGIEQVRKVAQALASAGARIDRQCGLHVHVGTDGMSANDVAMVLARYARFESVIDGFMPSSRRANNNTYCRSISNLVGRRINGQSFRSIPEVVSAMGGDRYQKVNMQAYNRHRTIEFRQHSGTCNATKIENWVRFILGFVEASIGQASPVEATGSVRSARGGRRVRRNSIDAKMDAVIRAFRAAPGHCLSVREIASAGGWSMSSVPPYLTRLRQERGCQIRKVRGTNSYILVGNTGRLSADAPTTTVETRQAARRVQGIANIASDSVFRGIPNDVVSFYEERREDFAN
jgi:hypothetical protein